MTQKIKVAITDDPTLIRDGIIYGQPIPKVRLEKAINEQVLHLVKA